ncbi:hypothetical protein B0H19DRAFT_1385163 [Mycena capillaripes]|nr:hypothetical protein B0H19DRAFT_1385163 [Mycena capillaripes]
MLDTTRAVSTSTLQNPLKFDGCGISNALYAIPARIFISVLDALSFGRPPLVLLTKDLVLGHQSRTCAAQMRIRISSTVRLGTRAALQSVNQCRPKSNDLDRADHSVLSFVSQHPADARAPFCSARPSFPPRGSLVYDMHHDHQHCRPPAPAFCSSTTSNAMHSATTKPLAACLTRLALATSPRRRATPTPSTRHAVGAAIPRRARCRRESEGAATIFGGVIPSAFSARTSSRPPRAQRPMRPFAYIAYTACLGSRRSPNYPLHYYPRARRSSTPTRLTPCLRALGRAALDAVRAKSTKKLLSRIRDVPPLPARRRAAPPTTFLPPPAPAVTGLDSTTAPPAISHATMNPLHAARDRPRRRTTPTRSTRQRTPQSRPTPPAARAVRDARVRRPPCRLHRVPALHNPLDQCSSTPAPAAFFSITRNASRVRSTRHSRSSSSASSSSPSHTPPPSTVLTVRRARLGLSPTRHRCLRPEHLQQSLLTEHAAFIASPRVLTIFSAVPTLRSEPAPGTHHEHDVHAMHVAYPCAATGFSGAPLSAQSQVLSRTAIMTRTYAAHVTAVPHHPRHFRPGPARIHHLERRSALTARLPCTYLPRCVAHIPHLRPAHPTTALFLSAVPLPDTRASCIWHEDNEPAAPHALTGVDP